MEIFTGYFLLLRFPCRNKNPWTGIPKDVVCVVLSGTELMKDPLLMEN